MVQARKVSIKHKWSGSGPMERSVDLSFRHNRTIWYVLTICLLVYIFSAKGTIEVSDTVHSVQTAQAIVTRGQLDIPDDAPYTFKGPDGRSYSKYGIGLPLYYVPAVALGDALVRVTGWPTQQVTWFLLSFVNIPFAILTLVVFAKLLRLFGAPQAFSSLCLLGLGLGTLTWRYTQSDFSEAMQMGLLILAVYGLIRRTPKAILIAGISFAWLFLVKQLYAVYLPILLVYLLSRRGTFWDRFKRTALFMFPFTLAGAFDLWLNFVRFGSVWQSGYGGEAEQFQSGQIGHTIPSLLWSLDKGLLVFCPILVLCMFGWKAFIKEHQAEATLCDGLIVFNLILIAEWYGWDGGWSWGPRYLVPFIPLWFLHIAFLPKRWQSGRRLWLIASVVLAAVMAQVPGILVSDQETHVIKDLMLTPQERNSAPSDYVASWILLRHKLVFRNEVYRISEFHVPGDRELNLTQYPTLAGWNLWTEQLARQLNLRALRWLSLFSLVWIGYLIAQVVKLLRAEIDAQPREPWIPSLDSYPGDMVHNAIRTVTMLLSSALRGQPSASILPGSKGD